MTADEALDIYIANPTKVNEKQLKLAIKLDAAIKKDKDGRAIKAKRVSTK